MAPAPSRRGEALFRSRSVNSWPPEASAYGAYSMSWVENGEGYAPTVLAPVFITASLALQGSRPCTRLSLHLPLAQVSDKY